MMRNLTIERTTIIVVVMLLFAMAMRVPVDTDTWWHLRSGEYILDNGTINGDPFSHTQSGETWINHSWGSQLIMYATWQVGSNAGLALYTALLAVAGIMVLYPISAGNAYLRAFVLVLGASSAAVFWSARPQMISFFLSSVVLYLVYTYKRKGKDRLWFFVPLMWLWSNLHAGWSIAYIFMFAFLVGELFNNIFGIDENVIGWQGWRKLLLVTVVSIPFLALSPYSFQNMLVPLNTVNIGSLRDFIQEWNSPNFQGRETWPFIAIVMSLFGALWASRLKFDWSGFFLLIGTLFLALLYGRNIAVFAVVATPILTHHLDNALTERGFVLRTRQKIPSSLAMANLALVIVIALAVLVYSVGVVLPTTVDPAQEERLPVAAAAYLAENDLPREMFNSYNWGGYLMFAAPDYPVFIDGRTDLYGDFLRTYLDATLARDNWRDILAEYDINLVVVENGGGLDLALREETGWTLVYEDDLAVIHVKDSADEE
ncbi:MAG: hypothetical protein Q9P01_12050 [Anaerolineae bacterium]|nr:hypothetical protein [Anaerolineae bacterium]MDQ7035531.1 hypothetical protein [Anaerolineae bacterium]